MPWGPVPVRFKENATYRMVVWGETAGTASKLRCMHLTVVLKHKQRLGQQSATCGPLASNNKATATRHGEKSWSTRSAIASSEPSRAQTASCPSHTPTGRKRERERERSGAVCYGKGKSNRKLSGTEYSVYLNVLQWHTNYKRILFYHQP